MHTISMNVTILAQLNSLLPYTKPVHGDDALCHPTLGILVEKIRGHSVKATPLQYWHRVVHWRLG